MHQTGVIAYCHEFLVARKPERRGLARAVLNDLLRVTLEPTKQSVLTFPKEYSQNLSEPSDEIDTSIC